MSSAPSIMACLDGIDGVGKSSVARVIKTSKGFPTVTCGRRWDGTPWPTEVRRNSDLLVMNTLRQLGSALPTIVIDRSLASTVAYNPGTFVFEDMPWEKVYPKSRTVFITIVDDIGECIRREGLDPYRQLFVKRQVEQKRFMDVSSKLGSLGYRTRIISGQIGVERVAEAVLEEIARAQLEELERMEEDDE